ncbi:hypothetical protein CYMTET_26395 [Cymbomonas tetramitiformis]|uniref:Uncharacterized protein n=1 Tax=Cymbomonas tetramitiformis TaxID=36881 RepID=A0AAE0FSJ8_9CHLO|nr:hypothetical protein CYMTET_26395 [Cymbomonas tetramitiformis]
MITIMTLYAVHFVQVSNRKLPMSSIASSHQLRAAKDYSGAAHFGSWSTARSTLETNADLLENTPEVPGHATGGSDDVAGILEEPAHGSKANIKPADGVASVPTKNLIGDSKTIQITVTAIGVSGSIQARPYIEELSACCSSFTLKFQHTFASSQRCLLPLQLSGSDLNVKCCSASSGEESVCVHNLLQCDGVRLRSATITPHMGNTLFGKISC